MTIFEMLVYLSSLWSLNRRSLLTSFVSLYFGPREFLRDLETVYGDIIWACFSEFFTVDDLVPRQGLLFSVKKLSGRFSLPPLARAITS